MLQSKYNYEHVYFIYMICNNKQMLIKTLDYLFYILNNHHNIKWNNNLSNILSLLFHFLKFRNIHVRNYGQEHFIELYLIVYYVLGVRQLSHLYNNTNNSMGTNMNKKKYLFHNFDKVHLLKYKKENNKVLITGEKKDDGEEVMEENIMDINKK